VSQMSPYRARSAKPPRTRLVTPQVALTAGHKTPARPANLSVSAGRSNAGGPRANRGTRYRPSIASSVLPVAIPIDVKTDLDVVTLARNATAKMPGQTR